MFPFSYLLLPAVVMLPAGIYLYLFFRRFLTLFRLKKEDKKSKGLSLILTIPCILLAWNLFSLRAVILFYFLAVCLVMDGINLVYKKVKKNTPGKSNQKEAQSSHNIAVCWSFIYRSGIVGILVVAVSFTAGALNMHNVRRTSYDLTVSGLEQGKRLKLAVISDLHLGTTMDAEKLTEYCADIESEQPDLLILAGDLFDENTSKSEMEAAAIIFGQVKSKYGTYYVFGNHDPNLYTPDPEYTMQELRTSLEIAGVHVMEDEQIQIDSDFYLIGRRDAGNPDRMSSKELTEGLDDGKLMVAVDHQPVSIEENAEAGIDLQISGHTHAGQIWPTGQLMELLGVNQVNYGWKQFGDLQVVVSSGIAGWGYPIRTGGYCEYVILNLNGK